MKRLPLATALTVIFCICAFFFLSPANAMHPPSKQEIERYKEDGSFAERLKTARKIGNNKTAPHLVQKMQQNIKRMSLKAEGFSDAEIETRQKSSLPPLACRGMPTKGTVKVLVLLVDFPDYPHTTNQTVQDINAKFFDNGDSNQYPYESLRNYYQRSSYQQLSITGNVLGWHTAQNYRSYYANLGEEGQGVDALIKEAINNYNNKGHDFTQYDTDNDGTIDAVYIKWTGPDNGWSGFWWAYQWYFHDSNYTVDGMHLNSYVWSWYNNSNYDDVSGVYNPKADIHETGHLLGLPDYYDYKTGVGPGGGIGDLDMMDNNWGDHNCFSKYLLEWLTPDYITSGTKIKTLNPSGTSQDTVLLLPENTGDDTFSEYFMAQYRKRSNGNDPSDYPADGLLIWHVDATLDSSDSDFLYDNSYTSHKLLALEQADGLQEIENNNSANAGDYYLPPKVFNTSSSPNSNKYNGTVTKISVDNLSVPADTMSAIFTGDGVPTLVNGVISGQIKLSPQQKNDLSGYTVFVEGTAFTSSTDGEGKFSFNEVPEGNYNVVVEISGYTPVRYANVAVTGGSTKSLPLITLWGGDADGDGKINITDFGIMADSFFSTTGSSNYSQNADFNADGQINIMDFGIMSDNFFKFIILQ